MLELVAEIRAEGEPRHLVLVEEVYSDDDEPFTLFVNADHYTTARRTLERSYYWTLEDAQAVCLTRFGIRPEDWRDAESISFPYDFRFDYRIAQRGIPLPRTLGFEGAEVVARIGDVEHPDGPSTRVLDVSGNREGLRRLAAMLLLVADGEQFDASYHVHLDREYDEAPFLVSDIDITLRAPSYHGALKAGALRQWSTTVNIDDAADPRPGA